MDNINLNKPETDLGYVADDRAGVVIFPFVADFVQRYGAGGEFMILNQRPDEGEAYAVPASQISVDDTSIRWTLSAYDTAIAGDGLCQLCYVFSDDDGAKMSRKFVTRIHSSLIDAGETPEPTAAWIEVLGELVLRAEAAAASAEAATVHQPIIGANGNWFVWDQQSGQYVDSMTSARPEFVIVVGALPEVGQTGIIYLLANGGGAAGNLYDEYIWLPSSLSYEKIGSTAIDLSGVVRYDQSQTLTSAEKLRATDNINAVTKERTDGQSSVTVLQNVTESTDPSDPVRSAHTSIRAKNYSGNAELMIGAYSDPLAGYEYKRVKISRNGNPLAVFGDLDEDGYAQFQVDPSGNVNVNEGDLSVGQGNLSVGQGNITTGFGEIEAQNGAVKGGSFIDNNVNKNIVPVAKTVTIPAASWSALSSADPYDYSVTVTPSWLSDAEHIRLCNDAPVLFAEHGFAIASADSSSMTIYSIGAPTAAVTLTFVVSEVMR